MTDTNENWFEEATKNQELITLNGVSALIGLPENALLGFSAKVSEGDLAVVKLSDGQYATTPTELRKWFDKYIRLANCGLLNLEQDFLGIESEE